jgi:hypothetical protein
MAGANGKFALLQESRKELLSFLKSKYALYHLSNVFFRDLQYGIAAFLDWKMQKPRYSEAEELARQLVDTWVSEGILKTIGNQAYVLNYPEFRKPPVKPAAPAKPAPQAKPTQTPASAASPEKKEPQQQVSTEPV